MENNNENENNFILFLWWFDICELNKRAKQKRNLCNEIYWELYKVKTERKKRETKFLLLTINKIKFYNLKQMEGDKT